MWFEVVLCLSFRCHFCLASMIDFTKFSHCSPVFRFEKYHPLNISGNLPNLLMKFSCLTWSWCTLFFDCIGCPLVAISYVNNHVIKLGSIVFYHTLFISNLLGLSSNHITVSFNTIANFCCAWSAMARITCKLHRLPTGLVGSNL